METDDEIRALCVRVSETQDQQEFESLLSQLRFALAQHMLEIENLGIDMILKKPRVLEAED